MHFIYVWGILELATNDDNEKKIECYISSKYLCNRFDEWLPRIFDNYDNQECALMERSISRIHTHTLRVNTRQYKWHAYQI